VEISGSVDSEAINRMGLGELLQLANAWGIDPSAPPALEAQ
jgi:hypothetical protein